MSKILGLDLGTNSIGWALVDTNESVIKGIGSRIFPMGVNLEKGHEVSKNATRREKRQTRRQTFRRKKRKRYISSILQNKGMFPNVSNLDKELTKETLNDELKNFFAINPYKCRARAYMGEKLSLLEIGRILYHFAQRRGYKESLKGMDKEEGKLYEGKPKEGITGINLTKEKIVEHGTLGNYFYNEDPHKVRIRSRYTTRRMYLDEFEIIWENQKKFYLDILTEELKQKLGNPEKGLLFYQRPLRSQKHLIGHCTFEPSKPRCPVSAIPFEEFRMHQFINTIKNGEDSLNDEERSIVKELFNSKEKFDFREIKKKLKLEGGTFNYKDDHKVVGNKTISNFRKIFGEKRWDEMNFKEREDAWHIKMDADDREWFTNYAKEKWQLDEKAINKLIRLKFKDDYANLSRKAINNILPFLKKGHLYNEAVLLGGIVNAFSSTVWNEMTDNRRKTIEDTVIAYVGQKSESGTELNKIKRFLVKQFKFTDKQLAKLYHHSFSDKESDVSEKLPEPENLRNPIVQQALFELKRIVNNIIDEYEKPDEIKIELARDLKSSKEKREKIKYEILDNEKRNDEAKKLLDEYGKKHTRNNIQKVILWKECDHTCPYTGEKIGIGELFNDGYVQIEHIVPYSVSLNNSMQNKTLCLADENKSKGDRTPYQFYGGNEKKWNEVKSRAYKLFKQNYSKYMRFVSKKVPDADEFISRQLNDTRYISKAAKDYLKNVCGKVDVTQGSTTSLLRHYWGLDNILSDAIDVGNIEDGEYYGAVNENNEFVELIKWNFDNKENDLKKLTAVGKVIEGNVKDKKFYPYKTRDDHRHHAIDALTVALTKKGYLQKISTLRAKGKKDEEIFYDKSFPKPWKNFWEDANHAVEQILVSHKKTDRIITKTKKPLFDNNGKPKKNKSGKVLFSSGDAARGELHKESVYGLHIGQDGKEYYHITKPLEFITSKTHINKIVDDRIRNIILNKLSDIGIDIRQGKFSVPKKAFFDYDDIGNKIPKIFLPNKNGEPVPVKKVRIKEFIGNAARLKDTNQYVNPRNNHHVVIYKNTVGELKERVVTFWEVVERVKQGLSAINKQPEPGAEFVTSLQKNDMFLLGLMRNEINWEDPDYKLLVKHLYRVQKFTSGDYYFRNHFASTIKIDIERIYIKGFGDGKTGWQYHNPIKVKISSLGKIGKY